MCAGPMFQLHQEPKTRERQKRRENKENKKGYKKDYTMSLAYKPGDPHKVTMTYLVC